MSQQRATPNGKLPPGRAAESSSGPSAGCPPSRRPLSLRSPTGRTAGDGAPGAPAMMAGAALLSLLLLAAACGDDVPITTGSGPVARKAKPSASASIAPPPKLDFVENEFTESEQSRDPFRSFLDQFKETGDEGGRAQRTVMLSQYSIDELQLRAIVLGANPALAMLVDPSGKGHSVKRGQYVGKAETVQSPGTAGTTYEVNWRVDRIRRGSVVLVRDDPRNPDVPSATRVLELRPANEVTVDTPSEPEKVSKAAIEAEVRRRLQQVKGRTAPTVIIRQQAPAPAPAPDQGSSKQLGVPRQLP